MFLSAIPTPDAPEYCYHQYLWAYFDKPKGDSRPFIFRVLDKSIVMLSREPPSCHAVALADRIEAGNTYQFDVLVNPVQTVWNSDHTHKTRVPYTDNKARLAWLGRRVKGADIRFAQVFDRPQRIFKKNQNTKIILNTCIIRGAVYVKDKSEFIATLLNGIGGRGAWGCGLMVLPEVMTC